MQSIIISFSVVNVDSNSGVIEVKNPNEPDQPPKTFTFDAVYDQKYEEEAYFGIRLTL